MTWNKPAEPEIWISLKDLLAEVEKRQIASHVSQEKSLIVKDLMRGIEGCRKLTK